MNCVAEREDARDAAGGTKRDWFVLHVKPRTEKKMMERLGRLRLFGYLPTYVKVTKVQRRKVRRELPIFPGYVFTKLFPDERLAVLKTNMVARTIPVRQARQMRHQLRQVKMAAGIAQELKVAERRFAPGDVVRVTSGPFYGMDGVVVRRGRSATLCLNVDILGVSVEVSVSPGDIEAKKP